MDSITNMWTILSKAGQTAGIVIFCFAVIKLIISALNHDSNQIGSNVFLAMTGAAVWFIFGILAGLNLNFG